MTKFWKNITRYSAYEKKEHGEYLTGKAIKKAKIDGREICYSVGAAMGSLG